MPAQKKRLLVTINDDSLDKIDSVVARLKKAGLTKVKKMDTIGIVSGDADPASVEKLKKIQGVRAVEEDAWMQLPPPDSPIQ